MTTGTDSECFTVKPCILFSSKSNDKTCLVISYWRGFVVSSSKARGRLRQRKMFLTVTVFSTLYLQWVPCISLCCSWGGTCIKQCTSKGTHLTFTRHPFTITGYCEKQVSWSYMDAHQVEYGCRLGECLGEDSKRVDCCSSLQLSFVIQSCSLFWSAWYLKERASK